MTGKEGAYPVYPLYNHPSKKNVIVCKTNLSVFLTNFSLSQTSFQYRHGRRWFYPKNPSWFQNLVLNKKLSRDAFCATPFQNAHGRAWFHAAASFCGSKNSPSRVYKEVHS